MIQYLKQFVSDRSDDPIPLHPAPERRTADPKVLRSARLAAAVFQQELPDHALLPVELTAVALRTLAVQILLLQALQPLPDHRLADVARSRREQQLLAEVFQLPGVSGPAVCSAIKKGTKCKGFNWIAEYYQE